MFEILLIVFAVLEIALALQKVDQDDGSQPTIVFSSLRILRLARIARVLRLARLHFFKDLIMMISGAIGGIRTLLWSILLIALPLYVLALIFRESLGPYAQ